KSLDITATELADRQDESDTSRKKLVELSRDFKKNTPEDTRKKVAPLLKSFQAEIDALSKRSKASETAFLSIYKKLVDVPGTDEKEKKIIILVKWLLFSLSDPLPILEQSVIQQQKVSKLQGRVREKEKDMQKVFFDKENALQEKQVSVAKKLGEAEHNAATLQAASSAERQVESLREELLAAQLETIDAISRASLEQELAAKERQISQLVSDVQQLQVTQGKAKELATSEISRLEDLLASKTTALRELESKLEEQNNYEEIKRELRCRYTELHSKYNEAVNTVKEQKELIGQLETDLLSVNALPSAFRGQGEGEAGPPTEKELVSNAVQQAVASGTGPLRPSVHCAFNPLFMRTFIIYSEGGLTGDNVESLLPIVASQRERFKVRNMELEAQLRHNQQQITVLQNEVDTLRSDNVKLYEKIKFLQSYPTKGQGGRDDDSAVSRYSSQYEQRLDPFSAFNQREKQQRYLGLSPYEKVTLNLGKFIMSNKVARTIAFFYTLLVHLMVLYKLAYTESCKRDVATECARRFAEHMHEVHGQ
ncbi:Protein CASP, partial [Acropora cervicornis]